MGENIADLAGLTVAYDAYRMALGGQAAPVLEGLSGDQRFYLGWAQVWRREYREANLLNRLLTDPHSPSQERVAVVRNLDPWYAAYDVQADDRLFWRPSGASGSGSGERGGGPRWERAQRGPQVPVAARRRFGCASAGLLFWAVGDPVFAAAFLAGVGGAGALLVALPRARGEDDQDGAPPRPTSRCCARRSTPRERPSH